MQQHIQTHDLRMCSEPLNILIERWSSYEQLQATKPPKTNEKCYNMYTQKYMNNVANKLQFPALGISVNKEKLPTLVSTYVRSVLTNLPCNGERNTHT